MKNNKLFLIILLISLPCHAIDMYFCTASNSKYFNNLMNLIGSLHKTNFEHLKEIAVFDIGLNQEQINKIESIEKTKIYKVELTHPDLLQEFTTVAGKTVPGWYAWKPVAIKQALDMYPYVIWIDAGTTVLKPLDNLFKYIKRHGYFLSTVGDNITNGKFDHDIRWQTKRALVDKFQLNTPQKQWILSQEAINASLIGVHKTHVGDFITPLYQMAKDLKNYEDDGTTPNGFGTARHDQSILALLAYTRGLKILRLDHTQDCPMYLNVNGAEVPFYITWNGSFVDHRTDIYCSRLDLSNINHYLTFIKYKQNENN